MSSSCCDRLSCTGLGADRIRSRAPKVSSPDIKGTLRLFAVALAAAMLAACAQAPVAVERPSARAARRHAPPEPDRTASFDSRAQTAAVAKAEAPSATDKTNSSRATQAGSYGLASYYGHQSRTASGEKFNAREFTAAHRTLPFGTRLRVTDVATGRSVTVRVNDRGPFVSGRVVDVSSSAAETLGIAGRGVARVKLEVVQ